MEHSVQMDSSYERKAIVPYGIWEKSQNYHDSEPLRICLHLGDAKYVVCGDGITPRRGNVSVAATASYLNHFACRYPRNVWKRC